MQLLWYLDVTVLYSFFHSLYCTILYISTYEHMFHCGKIILQLHTLLPHYSVLPRAFVPWNDFLCVCGVTVQGQFCCLLRAGWEIVVCGMYRHRHVTACMHPGHLPPNFSGVNPIALCTWLKCVLHSGTSINSHCWRKHTNNEYIECMNIPQ